MANSLNIDLTGKTVLIGKQYMATDQQDDANRTFTVIGGFGAKPETMGNALIGTWASNPDDAVRVEGYMVERLADPEPARTDLIDSPVIVAGYGSNETYIYGGVDPMGDLGVVTIEYNYRHGGSNPRIFCEAWRVAPADTPLADAKDPRIEVTKTERRGEPWLLSLPTVGVAGHRSFHKTKKEAVAAGQTRLAVADFHAAQSDEAVSA